MIQYVYLTTYPASDISTPGSWPTGRSPVSDQSLAHLARPDPSEERRECQSCHGCGEALLDAEYDPVSGELGQAMTECLNCGGEGSVSVHLYGGRR